MSVGTSLPQASFEQLEQTLTRTPVVAHVHPLLPLCLNAQTLIITDEIDLLRDLDDRKSRLKDNILILSDQANQLAHRFPAFYADEHPPVEAINRHMAAHLDYLRRFLLTTHDIAQAVEQDARDKHPDIVVLFLVDGLSYGDVLGWRCDSLQPCFVDGPSVTYHFIDGNTLNPKVGFASIVNRPSLARRLYAQGYTHPRGYTYWQPDTNVIADYMFDGIPTLRVANFESILRSIESSPVTASSYVQIVREGLDGLAHHKRELSRLEIEGAIQSIYDDVQRLLDALTRAGHRVCLYLTADHGILWKTEHSWETIPRIKDSHTRFTSTRPMDEVLERAVRVENSVPYYLFRYPYLGKAILINDSGTHGGLSYQESITPFAIFRG